MSSHFVKAGRAGVVLHSTSSPATDLSGLEPLANVFAGVSAGADRAIAPRTGEPVSNASPVSKPPRPAFGNPSLAKVVAAGLCLAGLSIAPAHAASCSDYRAQISSKETQIVVHLGDARTGETLATMLACTPVAIPVYWELGRVAAEFAGMTCAAGFCASEACRDQVGAYLDPVIEREHLIWRGRQDGCEV